MDLAGFGVIGNFAGHVESGSKAGTPKGLFPFYIPGASGFLGRACVDNSNLIIPKGANVHAEPEIAVRFGVSYYGGAIYELEALSFMAFNDASVRGEKQINSVREVGQSREAVGAGSEAPAREGGFADSRRQKFTKISQKKNFSTASKGAGGEIGIDYFGAGGICDRFSLVSFLRSGGEFLQYGECAKLSEYTYFYGELVEWIKDRLNSQPDFESLENLNALVATAGFPSQVLITLGSTHYEKVGLERYLRAGDEIQIIAFNHEKFSLADIEKAARDGELKNDENISVLTQKVSEL